MNTRNFTPGSLFALAVSAAAFTTFILLHYDTAKSWQLIQNDDYSRIQHLLAGATGWLAALLAMMTLTHPARRSGMAFAFLILALMIFFVHETYQYTGKVRWFPLIVGYTGIALSILDILTLTDTRLGRNITQAFGSELVAADIHERSVPRELIVMAGMGAAVVVIYALGFLLGGTLFVMAWVLLGARKSILQTLYIGIATFAFVYLLFEVILQYELHKGPVTEWLIANYLQ